MLPRIGDPGVYWNLYHVVALLGALVVCVALAGGHASGHAGQCPVCALVRDVVGDARSCPRAVPTAYSCTGIVGGRRFPHLHHVACSVFATSRAARIGGAVRRNALLAVGVPTGGGWRWRLGGFACQRRLLTCVHQNAWYRARVATQSAHVVHLGVCCARARRCRACSERVGHTR